MNRSSWLVPAALSCAVLAGCSAPATVSADAWVDRYCGALSGFAAAARKQPDIDPSSPTKTMSGLDQYVDDYVAAMDEAIANLKTVGPAPSPVGDTAVADLTASLTAFRTSMASVRKELDTSSAADLDKTLEPLSSLEEPPDPLQAIAKDPQLDQAAQDAPNCQKIPSSS